MKRFKVPLVARFYQKVKVGKATECWEWQGAIIQNGYGQIGKTGSKAYYAHRLSYELHKGPIPEGMFVCHSCDNKRCVNPNHLWVGTATENNVDALKKGRTRAKLTESAVRKLRNGSATEQEIADRHGVCVLAARKAKIGATWRHLDA